LLRKRLAAGPLQHRNVDRECLLGEILVRAGDAEDVRCAILTAARLEFEQGDRRRAVAPLNRSNEVRGRAVPVQVDERRHDFGELFLAYHAQVGRHHDIERGIFYHGSRGAFALRAVSLDRDTDRVLAELLVLVCA
jgi:hypothetical protein